LEGGSWKREDGSRKHEDGRNLRVKDIDANYEI
jgi:hypothetical protein